MNVKKSYKRDRLQKLEWLNKVKGDDNVSVTESTSDKDDINSFKELTNSKLDKKFENDIRDAKCISSEYDTIDKLES